MPIKRPELYIHHYAMKKRGEIDDLKGFLIKL
jgi:hypothetical protein